MRPCWVTDQKGRLDTHKDVWGRKVCRSLLCAILSIWLGCSISLSTVWKTSSYVFLQLIPTPNKRKKLVCVFTYSAYTDYKCTETDSKSDSLSFGSKVYYPFCVLSTIFDHICLRMFCMYCKIRITWWKLYLTNWSNFVVSIVSASNFQ